MKQHNRSGTTLAEPQPASKTLTDGPETQGSILEQAQATIGEPPGSASYFGTASRAAVDAPTIEEPPVSEPPGCAAYFGEVAIAPYPGETDIPSAEEQQTPGFLPGSPEYLGIEEVSSGGATVPCDDWFRGSTDVRHGFISGNTFLDKPVVYGMINGVAIFEGDIALGPAQLREAPQSAPLDTLPARGIGITGNQYSWPGGVLPWQTQPALRTRVLAAINHWEVNTGIRFVERTPANAAQYPDYVSFEVRDGCWSYVGRQGGMQVISLAAGCGFGAAIHEIGHALGLWHEQSREDRNRFVRIQYENITPGMEYNFDQHITDGDDIRGYDFGSIMHYGPTAFSKNGQPTIVPLGIVKLLRLRPSSGA